MSSYSCYQHCRTLVKTEIINFSLNTHLALHRLFFSSVLWKVIKVENNPEPKKQNF